MTTHRNFDRTQKIILITHNNERTHREENYTENTIRIRNKPGTKIKNYQIIKIDSVDAIKMTTREASKLIKGELGTYVTLHIRRPGYKKKYSFELTRSNITVHDVPYWSIDENSIGYIRITRFSRNTYQDFVKALKTIDSEKFIDLNNNEKWDSPEHYRDYNNNGKWDSDEKFADKNKNKIWDDGEFFEDDNENEKYDNKGQLKGLIIDLRGNSGGLLTQSTSILNAVTQKGETLLYTKTQILLAKISEKNGKESDALNILTEIKKRLLGFSKSSREYSYLPEVIFHLGQLYQQLGKNNSAYDQYRLLHITHPTDQLTKRSKILMNKLILN